MGDVSIVNDLPPVLAAMLQLVDRQTHLAEPHMFRSRIVCLVTTIAPMAPIQSVYKVCASVSGCALSTLLHELA